MLEVVQLGRTFGTRVAVEGATFAVRPGEVVGLVGPNGAGKTTLLQIIAGALAPTSGTALVCGHDILRRPLAAKRRLGYLPQTAPAYATMTVGGFLRFAARLHGLSRAAAAARIAQLAARLDLTATLDQPIAGLPEPCRRLVALAQAVLHAPSVLLLDAPDAGLDPLRLEKVAAELTALRDTAATVIATQRLDAVERLCSRVIVMLAGRIVADAAPDDLARRSRRHNAVRLALPPDADAAAIIAELALMPAVRAVEPVTGATPAGCRIFPWHGRPIIAEIAQFAASRGWPRDALRVEYGRLDDAFREITMPDAGHPL